MANSFNIYRGALYLLSLSRPAIPPWRMLNCMLQCTGHLASACLLACQYLLQDKIIHVFFLAHAAPNQQGNLQQRGTSDLFFIAKSILNWTSGKIGSFRQWDDLNILQEGVLDDIFRHVRAGYVHLHGSRAQLALIDRIAEMEARHAALLAQLPDQTRQHFRRRHAEASEAPGA